MVVVVVVVVVVVAGREVVSGRLLPLAERVRGVVVGLGREVVAFLVGLAICGRSLPGV